MNESSFGFERVAGKEKELTLEEAEERMRARIVEGLAEKQPPRYASFAVLIDANEEVLLFERMKEPMKGTFSLAGGKLDLSQKESDPKTQISTKLDENGLETPTNALARELVEELYGNELEIDDALMEQFGSKRFAIVYDARFNSYNFLFVTQALQDREIQCKKDEVGEIKRAQELDPAQMNALTRFALERIGTLDTKDETIEYGPVKHMILPEDVKLYMVREIAKDPEIPAILESGEELHEPAYLISY